MRDDSLFGSIDGPYSTSPRDLELALVESRVIGPNSAPRVGRFILLELVGYGGMGAVYAAFDPRLERKVAVKILHAGHSSERLLREARALAKVEHANILTIYEVGEPQGQAYIAMELIDGQSLGELRLRERLPWRRWLQLYIDAGRGLDGAHRTGLVHRDFKPDNVLLSRSGRVVVADFGLASEAPSGDGAHLNRTTGHRVAGPGRRSGTRYYMAPEQLARGACDARSDQYSFCLVLWEAVHSTVPLPPDRRLDENAWNALALERLATPGWLRRALHRGLNPDPDRRWPSMKDLVEQLQRGATRPRRAVRAMLAGLLALLALLVPVLARGCVQQTARSVRAEEEWQRRTFELMDDEHVIAAMREWDPAIISSLLTAVRDISRSAEWRNVAINTTLRPMSLAVLHGHSEELRGVAFSPRGDRVATASFDDTIRLWRTDGTGDPEVLVGHTGDVHIVEFSPGGRVLASSSRDGTLRLWDMSEPAVSTTLTGHERPVWFVAFSADGRRLVSSGDHGEIFLWERRDGGREREFEWMAELPGHEGDVFHVEISPDDRLLVSAGADGTARIWSIEQRTLLHTLDHGDNRLLRARFSPDGELVVTAPADGPARIWRVVDGELLHVGDDQSGVQDARFDPSGRWVAMAGNDGRVTLWSVAIGRTFRTWKFEETVTAISFSPAGDSLAAASAGGLIKLWPSDGEGGAHELAGHHGRVFQLEFSHDGRYLISSSNDRTARVWDLAAIRARAARHLINEPSHVMGAAFGASRVALSTGGAIDLYDLHTARRTHKLRVPRGQTRELVLSEDERALAARTDDGAVYRWDLADADSGVLMATAAKIVRFLPGGELIVGDGDSVALYSAAGESVCAVHGMTQEITSISGLLGGRYLVVTGRDGKMVRLDVSRRFAEEKLLPATDVRHLSSPGCPDGRLPVWNTREAKVVVWDVPLGVVVRQFDVGTERPVAAELDCRTGLLAVRGVSGGIHVQTADGRELFPPGQHRLGRGAWRFLLNARPALLALEDPRAGLRIYEASTLRELAALEGMGAPVQVHADDENLWVVRDEHGVTRMRLAQLRLSSALLKRALAGATTACPDIEKWRAVHLGDEQRARQSAALCESRQGRAPKASF